MKFLKNLIKLLPLTSSLILSPIWINSCAVTTQELGQIKELEVKKLANYQHLSSILKNQLQEELNNITTKESFAQFSTKIQNLENYYCSLFHYHNLLLNIEKEVNYKFASQIQKEQISRAINLFNESNLVTTEESSYFGISQNLEEIKSLHKNLQDAYFQIKYYVKQEGFPIRSVLGYSMLAIAILGVGIYYGAKQIKKYQNNKKAQK
ncbi:hypothetical protein [Mycoplasmopsis gallopavonis]|nr:hypothetical protein [Mycoplasmopsis gallopavonis]RIV16784.1 hypothetical protein D1113_00895 [Mycoplasmopsis gallopavonis]